jgi:hypothetical protein
MFDLKELLVLAPEPLHPRLVVAGGYLADPEKACDIDLWLLSGTKNIPGSDEYLWELRRHLDKVGPKEGWKVWDPFVDYELSPLPEEYSEGNLGQKGYRYVGRFQKEGWPKPVQFFIAPYKTVGELLRDFDISTHQRARVVNLPTEVWVETTTLPGEMPRVTNWDTPSTTLERLHKLSRRYGFSLLDNPDVSILEVEVNKLQTAA